MPDASPGSALTNRTARTTELSAGRERGTVVALAAAIVLGVAGYLALRSSGDGGTLLPYQTLARDLVLADQAMFTTLKTSILDLEAVRARTGRWPEPEQGLGLPRGAPPSEHPATPTYAWTVRQQGIIVNYLARPVGVDSSAAWLVVYREPDPSAPVDTAPNDEEHHRLPDGTVLHVSIWLRRFGAHAPDDFLPQPEVAGWTQVLTAPLARRAPTPGAADVTSR